jgi:hypothetical protein
MTLSVLAWERVGVFAAQFLKYQFRWWAGDGSPFNGRRIGFSNALVLSSVGQSHFLFKSNSRHRTVAEDAVLCAVPEVLVVSIFRTDSWAVTYLGVFLGTLGGKWVWIIGAGGGRPGVLRAFVPHCRDNAMLFSFRENPRIFAVGEFVRGVVPAFQSLFRKRRICNRVIAFWSKTSLLVFVFL